MTPRLARLFLNYSVSHQTRGNRMTHYLGIPAIMLSLFALLSRIPLTAHVPQSTAAWVLAAAAAFYYLFLDWSLALRFLPVIAFCVFAGPLIPMNFAWLLFAIGWILQLIGHGHYEKKNPAFFTNLQHLLIGPLWVFYSLLPGRHHTH